MKQLSSMIVGVAVASPFANFRHCNTKVCAERYPRTVAFVDRILARPSLATWIEREADHLGKASGLKEKRRAP